MIKHFAILLTTMCLAFCANAQSLSAKQVLERTAAKISNSKSISAQFVSTAEGEQAKGKLTIAAERFSMVADGYAVWYDGQDMWSMYEQSGEVSLSTPTADELLEINPFDIINRHAEQFKARITGSTPKSYTIALTANNAGQSIKSAVLTIDSQTWLPTDISAMFANGATIKINITSATVGNAALPKSEFQFPAAKYPGIEIIDLR